MKTIFMVAKGPYGKEMRHVGRILSLLKDDLYSLLPCMQALSYFLHMNSMLCFAAQFLGILVQMYCHFSFLVLFILF
jgi:hypothetical protein